MFTWLGDVIWHLRLHYRLKRSEDCHWCMLCHRSIR
jgi:hypothetical protein